MINILFSGNSKVFDGALTTMLSILKRTSTTEPFRFYIYTMDITRIKPEYTPMADEMVEFLDTVAKSYNKGNSVIKIDVGDIYKREFEASPNESCYCSPYTLLRLFADLIPDVPDKLLYLDIDIMFNRDITLLYNQNIEGYEYAAAPDHYGKYFIHPRYINAGVLLLNIKEIKKTGMFAKARDLIRKKKWIFADQDAVWHATTKNLILPQRFNDQKFCWKHTVVRHFSKRLFWLPYPHTANIKQWKVSEIHKKFGYYQFDDILYEYIYLKKLFENNQKLKAEKQSK